MSKISCVIVTSVHCMLSSSSPMPPSSLIFSHREIPPLSHEVARFQSLHQLSSIVLYSIILSSFFSSLPLLYPSLPLSFLSLSLSLSLFPLPLSLFLSSPLSLSLSLFPPLSLSFSLPPPSISLSLFPLSLSLFLSSPSLSLSLSLPSSPPLSL